MVVCVGHLQDLDQEQQNSPKTVAGREESLKCNIELDEERNVDIDIDAPVNPLATVRCDALKWVKDLANRCLKSYTRGAHNEDGNQQVNNNGDLSVEQAEEINVELDDGSHSNVNESFDLEDDCIWGSTVLQALV